MQRISIAEINYYAICWIVIYLVDSATRRLNNRGQASKAYSKYHLITLLTLYLETFSLYLHGYNTLTLFCYKVKNEKFLLQAKKNNYSLITVCFSHRFCLNCVHITDRQEMNIIL